MRNIYDIILAPLITEKSNLLKEKENKISFKVDKNANKLEIKEAVEKIFKVKVLDVKSMNVTGKKKRVGRYIGKKAGWKKALVTLREGDRIEFFEG